MKTLLFLAAAFAFGGACTAWSGAPLLVVLLCFMFAGTFVAMAVDEWEGC